MFRGHRAWFSQSVSPGPREVWVAGGGTLTHWQDADYLFGSDAAHPDTRRIHESLDYLEGRATVFHSRYLSTWARTNEGAELAVALGHFVLPPACLQEDRVPGVLRGTRDTILTLRRYSQPNENPTDEAEAARKGSEEEEEDAPDLAESEEETGSRAAPPGEFPCRALREYPTNNMVTGYASARHMQKYAGELRDFTPGTSGYVAYWVQGKINLRSYAKAKTKRKL
ncbi:TERB2 protein, partial [Nyctibius bracteatus]|nr:TERB2 protein [Nyctibius bracteatus]